ncbi:hypothetical protein B296_00031538 [Ensete ventricosum]|uniref:Uncharacterized protein n=1 Tax=Ensete ventricosum TaxID=4639 RepID=A0A426Y3K6_ENSVE|nr:hypothetical protein B296_00031538 [Ensete ventricosum]
MSDVSRFPRSITDADLPRGMDPFKSRGELLVLLPAVRLDDMVGQLPSPNHEVGGCRGYRNYCPSCNHNIAPTPSENPINVPTTKRVGTTKASDE